MGLGVLDTIGLAASLVFALPLANYAVVRLLDGHVALGGGLLVVAVAMVVLPQYLLDPGRLIGSLLRGLLPSRLRSETPGRAEPTDDETGGERDRDGR
jgi:hypothetical protein